MNHASIVVGAAALFAAAVWGAEHPVRTRRAFRAAIERDPACVRRYLNHSDAEVRRYALYLVAKQQGVAALPDLEKALKDPDPQVELLAAEALAGLTKQSPEAQKLLMQAAASTRSLAVAETAARASWPFHRDVKLLRNDPDWDHEVTVLKTVVLPEKNWSFITDPMRNGHLKGFFEPMFDASAWRKINLGYWEFQGVEDYDGIAWYRIKFRMPPEIRNNAVEIHFGGVDESAWVWLNGKYLGCHDLGEEGEGKPFALDCSREIIWNGENVLAVRIGDTGNAGGLTHRVHIEVLQ